MKHYTLFSKIHDDAYVGEHPEGDLVMYGDLIEANARIAELEARLTLVKDYVHPVVVDRALALIGRWCRAFSVGPLSDQYLRSESQEFIASQKAR